MNRATAEQRKVTSGQIVDLFGDNIGIDGHHRQRCPPMTPSRSRDTDTTEWKSGALGGSSQMQEVLEKAVIGQRAVVVQSQKPIVIGVVRHEVPHGNVHRTRRSEVLSRVHIDRSRLSGNRFDRRITAIVDDENVRNSVRLVLNGLDDLGECTGSSVRDDDCTDSAHRRITIRRRVAKVVVAAERARRGRRVAVTIEHAENNAMLRMTFFVRYSSTALR